jgi:leader peptidase (prepilin peptidase)/N-methyltransferase
MTIAQSILFFLIGLAIGSFLNVVIFRIDELSTIIKDRSRCPKCKKTLAWYDLIPFLSFVLLRARCRYCNEKISWQYPLVEVSTGILFLLLFLTFGLSWGLIFYLIVFSLLIVVFVYDIKTQMVPEIFVWIALALASLGGWYFGEFTFLSAIIGSLIAGGFLGFLVYFSKEQWMGAGDVKIGVILGLLTGYPNVLVALFAAFVFGSIVGIILILSKQKTIDRQSLKLTIPFAPFLILGILFSMVWGSEVINWYLNLFLF